jgi:Tfp pilus assembly protein PilV
MTRRPAVTLIEVLVSMFIMAIGMLALLVLFPLGAISMGQALKDDRCASTASMAENVAIATNVRHDSTVLAGFAASSVVYVDPYGVAGGLGNVGTIPRVSTSFVSTAATIDRWFSLPDDIAFAQSGTPDASAVYVDRGRRYTYAYLLSRPQQAQDNLVNLTVVVYSSRPVGALTGTEWPFAATPNPLSPTNSIVIAQPASNLTIKIGGWILDAAGNFYRVTNIADNGAGSTVLELTPNLKATFGASSTVVIMDYVAEVFDKGTSWQP